MSRIRNKKVVLVSAIGGDIGQTYAKSIAGEEFSCIGCDMNPLPCKKSFLKQFFQVPPARDAKGYLDAIGSIIKKSKVDFVVPISEPEIKVFHEHRDITSSWGVKILINNEDILDHFLDKYDTVQYLKKMGIKVPKTYLLQDYKDQLDFPMIIKKRRGCGGKGVWKVESELDLNYLKRKDDGTFLIQEYIGEADQEYTTGIFSDGKNVSNITFKRKLGMGGLSVEVELVESPSMDQMAMKIASYTKLVGSLNVQTRLFKGVFIPFEVNPRFSSTVGFRKQFGFLDCLWWLKASLGAGPYVYKRKFKSGKGVRYLTESYTQMERIHG